MSQVQSGILPEHCRAAIWIEANVKGDVDALRAASKVFIDKLASFQAKFPDAQLGAVVAFGNTVWHQLSGGEGAEELKDFIPYGKGLAPATQYDVLIHILSLRHDVNFSVAQAAVSAFGDSIEVQEEVHGFRWVEERDLSGFVDGTENPAGLETRREVAVIKDGVDAGGSYVFVQRWEHNLNQLNRMNEENPGVEEYKQSCLIFKGGRKATFMKADMSVVVADSEAELKLLSRKLARSGKKLLLPFTPLYVIGTSLERLRNGEHFDTVYDWFSDATVHIARPDE